MCNYKTQGMNRNTRKLHVMYGDLDRFNIWLSLLYTMHSLGKSGNYYKSVVCSLSHHRPATAVQDVVDVGMITSSLILAGVQHPGAVKHINSTLPADIHCQQCKLLKLWTQKVRIYLQYCNLRAATKLLFTCWRVALVLSGITSRLYPFTASATLSKRVNIFICR